MRYYIFLLNLVLVSVAYTQTASDVVREIQKTYTTVNNLLDSYEKYIVNLENQSSVYNYLETYLLNGQIEKALLTCENQQNNKITELYFKDGMLVLLIDKKLPGNNVRNEKNISQKAGEQDFFYLHEGKIIKYVSSDNQESWNSSIPDKMNKEKYVSSMEDKVMMFFNSRLLADIPMYSEKTIEFLFEEKPEIRDAIYKLIKTSKDVISPLLATMAKIIEEERNIYSAFGEISWGEGQNSTYLVFDLLQNKIYIWNNVEGEISVYCPDNNYPKVFREWVNDFQ